MSCYNPMAGYPDYDAGLSKNGKIVYRIEGRFNPEMKSIYPGVIKIPCGKCLGCRLDYSRTWADRMILELASMREKKAIFVTLTYDNDHVTFFQGDDLEDAPIGMTLVKKDVQDFLKRLRKSFSCRYYLAGEYGPKTGRPHYHAIIFGIGLEDFDDLQRIGRNELGQDYYTSKWFADRWQNGFVTISDVSYNTCAYVSRYVMKKVNTQDIEDGRQPEFVLMSRRPGIGFYYYDFQLKPKIGEPDQELTSHIYVSSPDGSKKVAIPSYFLDKISVEFPDKYGIIKYQRVAAASDRELIKLSNTDLSYIDMLEVEYNQLLNKTKILFNRRDL